MTAPADTDDAVVCIHADDALVVVEKPAGLLAVPGRGPDKQDCLLRRLRRTFPEALVVHRLDMATSGLMLFALSLPTQRALSLAFERREIYKRYEAIVAGRPSDGATQWQEISAPLAVDWPHRPRQRVDVLDGKPALTRWRLLGDGPWPGSTRVELEPLTGRTHQLRVHLQHLGHPIVGDALYAPHLVSERFARLALHACTLKLTHPSDGTPCSWHSRVPF